MRASAKICGLNTRPALEAAIAGGADYVGFVIFPKSPRHVDISTAKSLAAAARGRARSVVLLVDPDNQLFDEVCSEVAPDFIQLHGHEAPERVCELRGRGATRIIKAIGIATAADVARADPYRQPGRADMILFDAAASPDAPHALPGGNGLKFDWRILDGIAERFGFALAGGLDAGNVSEAIRLTRASIVDVSSGVESSPGIKDPKRIAEFLDAVKSTSVAAGKVRAI